MLISVYKVDNHRVDKLGYVRRICVVVLAPRIKNREKENFNYLIQVSILLLLTNRLDLSHAPCKVSPLCTSFLKLNFDFVTIHNVLLFILSKWPSFDQYPKKKRRWGPRSLLIGYNINPMKIFQGSPSHIHFDLLQRVVLFRDCERERKVREILLPSSPDQTNDFLSRTNPFSSRSQVRRNNFNLKEKIFETFISLVLLLGDIDQTHFVVFCIKTHSYYRFHMLQRIQKIYLSQASHQIFYDSKHQQCCRLHL